LDLLPQAWAALAGAAAAPRTTRALAAAAEHLVRPDDGLVALFAPPFDETPRDPGYIKSYPPGVRENGGQYTHAAIWLAMAHARRGEGGKAAAILRLLNPVEHARQPAEAERFRVEPYAVAADVYTLPGRIGQGGWSWYTGSSGWMYRVWLEEVLGVQRTGDRLRLNPSVPADWERYEVSYRYGETVYEIAVENPDHVEHGVVLVELDGEAAAGGEIVLRDDGGTHRVRVRMGAEASRADEDALPVENGGRQDTPHPLAPVPSLNRRNGFEH
ncbi:MAG: GH36-type glycosyl hydrolase domain-containing protein, partial [Bacteroidota bacterium]